MSFWLIPHAEAVIDSLKMMVKAVLVSWLKSSSARPLEKSPVSLIRGTLLTQ